MSGRHHGGRGRSAGLPSAKDAAGWFAGRLPDAWFTAPPEVVVDREEITVLGTLPEPAAGSEAPGDEPSRSALVEGRVARFREETRETRIEIARQAEHRYGRKIAWGVRLAGREVRFTALSVPVMTRLRQPERRVLDTLVDAGVARSRSEALAWAVRLVEQHADTWLTELREALEAVADLRTRGPVLDDEPGSAPPPSGAAAGAGS